MFNYDDDVIGQYRRSRILAPVRRNPQQTMSQFQSPDLFRSTEPQRDGNSEDLTAAEEAANQSGGVFYNPENMRKFMEAMDANDKAPRPRMDALTSHLMNQPTREEYAPSGKSRFGAALVGFGTGLQEGASRGMAAGKEIIDRPYREARQDWADRTGPLEYAANLEEKDRGIRNNSLQRAATVGLNYDKFKRDLDKDEIAKKEAAARMRNIESLIKDRQSGISTVKEDENGNLIGVRKDGTIQQFGVKGLEWKTYLSNKNLGERNAKSRERTAASGERNAETGEMNARTNVANSNTAAGNLEQRKTEQRDSTPQRMEVARDLALKSLTGYTAFNPFMELDENGKMRVKPLNPETMNPEIYRMFMLEVDRRMQTYGVGNTDIMSTPVPKPVIPRVKN